MTLRAGIPATDYLYELPPELIAQDPAPRRADARLLLLRRGGGVAGESSVRELPRWLRPGDLLVLNDSRVLPARLHTRRTGSGGYVELLLVRPDGAASWLALARPARRLRPGSRLRLARGRTDEPAGPELTVLASGKDGHIRLTAGGPDLVGLAEAWGDVPLPPYIRRRSAEPEAALRRQRDRDRYQTVYAHPAGSVAAPTAGLHFEPALLAALAARGIEAVRVTLHVGPGTFQPPSENQIRCRRLHREIFRYPATVDDALARTHRAGGRVIAVGTTSLRVLETVRGLALDRRSQDTLCWPEEPTGPVPLFTGVARRQSAGWEVEGSTRLFLRPPDEIAAADGLLTNFHLPGSSLLMLVAAFTGETSWREAYAHGIRARFRFYSYGDAMLILPGLGEEDRHDAG
jgi:S-adenosylmethionine:tRNA ribosyltransferase-isomerase